jgi:small subunit ribosomal protein S4
MSNNVKKSQHNLKITRRFEEDIWGVLATKNRPSNVLNYIYDAYQNNFKYKKLLKESKKSFFLSKKKGKFLYKVVTEEKEFRRKKRTLKINNYLNLLKLRRFYGNLGARKFRRSFRALALPVNAVTRSFAYFLESRLDVVLYRSNLFPSIYSARQYINHKKVFVNGSIVNKPGYRLKVEDIVSVSNPKLLYKQLEDRLKNDLVLSNYPAYLEVNYKLGTVIFCQFPTNEQIPYPFFMDIENLTNSFSK